MADSRRDIPGKAPENRRILLAPADGSCAPVHAYDLGRSFEGAQNISTIRSLVVDVRDRLDPLPVKSR
jgi:hypothetical protein